MDRRLALLPALLSGVLFVSATRADDARGWGYELPHEVMSPWCPGFSLADCGSGYAAELRAWILDQEKQGRPRAEVEAELLGRYGEKIRQAPKAEGRALFAYAIPLAALVAGAGVVAAFLRRQARGARVSAPVAGAPDAELAARIDRELAQFEATHVDD